MTQNIDQAALLTMEQMCPGQLTIIDKVSSRVPFDRVENCRS